MIVTRAFTKEWLKDEDIPYSDREVSTEVTLGHDWMDDAECVFFMEDDGHHYLLSYPVGKTEKQETPWYEELDTVNDLPRVELVTKLVEVKQWVPVED